MGRLPSSMASAKSFLSLEFSSSSDFSRLASLDIHAAILGFPFIDAGITHAVLPAQIGDRNAGLMLFDDADSLFFAEPVALHL